MQTRTHTVLIAVVVAALALFIGFYLGRASDGDSFTATVEKVVTQDRETGENTSTGTSSASGIDTSGLTPDQRKRLESYGIDPNRITPTMVACAEAKLGAARFGEVLSGAELSMSEKISLVACYRP